jgi:hypothetical protein
MQVGTSLLMKRKPKAQQKCTFEREREQIQEEALGWGSQDVKLLLESEEMEVVSPGKLGYVSLTLRDCATCHQLLPQVGQGKCFLVVRLGLLFSESPWGYGSARPCCVSPDILLTSAV